MNTCIGIVNQKGGSGKSSTAVALAYWLYHKQNYKTILIDADAQRSSSRWIASLPKTETIPYEVIGDADSLIEQIEPILQKHEFVVIDGPGSLAEVTRAIVLLSHLAVIPCQPTGLDLGSAADTVRLVLQARQIRKKLPLSVAFLNRAVKGTRLKLEARSLLGDLPGIHLLNSVVHQKQIIADAVGQQSTVWNIRDRTSTDSAREYSNLFTEILQCLENL